MKLRLTYTYQNTNAPALSNTVLETGVPINILDATVTNGAGEMVIDVPVSGEKLESVLVILRRQGVKARKIAAVITIDTKRCISCGACVSPCSAGAISQGPDWNVTVDLDKCIRCLLCVKACPLRAISYV